MNEKETVMAKPFENGFPGQALSQGKPPVIDEPGEAPPVDLSELPDPKARPDFPDTGPTFDHATDLPIIPAEQAFNPAPFDDDDDFPGDPPDFLDLF